MPDAGSADADTPPRGVRVHASLPAPPRRSAGAIIASALLHLALILLAIRLTQEVAKVKDTPAGNAIMKFMGGGGGGGGSGGVAITALTKPPPPPPPAVPEPIPVIPKVEAVPEKVKPAETPPPAKADTSKGAPDPSAAGTGGGSGGGVGTGTGTGRGSGVGAGSGSGIGGGDGSGRGGFPPAGDFMVIPPTNTPKELRGKTVEIAFQVASDGRVTDITVTPPIRDKDYAKKFDDAMRVYRFKPARDEQGRAVAGVAVMTVTF